MVKAAGFGVGARWETLPPVSKEKAESTFGAAISESSWLAISEAYALYGRRLSERDGTRTNKDPNDPLGWHKRRGDAVKGFDAAIKALSKIDHDFLNEVDELVSLEQSGGLESTHPVQRLEKAMDDILLLRTLVKTAQPLSREIMSEAESRKALARDVFAALESAGASLSNGWNVASTDYSYADLTGFENLAVLLEIHRGISPTATAKWLRDALRDAPEDAPRAER